MAIKIDVEMMMLKMIEAQDNEQDYNYYASKRKYALHGDSRWEYKSKLMSDHVVGALNDVLLSTVTQRDDAYLMSKVLKKWFKRNRWERNATREMINQFTNYIFRDEKESEYGWVTDYVQIIKKKKGW